MRNPYVVPMETLLSRWDNVVQKLRAELAKTPRWRFLKRRVMAGAIAILRCEIEDLQALSDAADKANRTGKYRKFEPGTRVRANQTAGFHRGAEGTVQFQEPGSHFRVWVLRDKADSPVFYYPDELDLLDA